MTKILIVEDDKDIASLERDYLRKEKFEVEIVTDGEAVLEKLKADKYDLVILDLMIPKRDGLEVCKDIRRISDIPIVIVTAKSEPIDIIQGLRIGSDDYITKPFDPAVLVARVKANINTYRRHKKVGKEIKTGELRILPKNHQVFVGETELQLPNKEFELLKFLAEHPNEVFRKEDLFEEVWGLDSLADETTITVHINRLREKIEQDPSHPKIIQTVWGVGYRLATE